MSWEVKSLDNIITFQRGFDLPKTDFKVGDFPVVGSTGIIGFHNEFKVKSPCIVTGRSGTLGVFQYLNEDFWAHNTTLWVKDFQGNHPKFIYYLLQTLDFKSLNGGVAVPTLNRNVLKNVFISYPKSLETQKRIASILSTYDDLIENNLKRIKLLEETAQNIYKEWFVNFRFPNYEHTEFDAESGLPVGWEMKKIEDCEIKIGDGNYSAKYPKSEEFIESGIPFFSTREMNDGRFNTNGVKRISEEQHLTLTKGHLKGGDVILSTRGSIGKVVYVDAEFEDCNINAQLVLFRCDNLNVYSKFLYYQLSMPQTFLRLINVGTGTAQPQLPIKTLKYFELLIASPKLQQTFDNAVKFNMEQISILSKQNQKLIEVRDILLPRLMNRTIEV